MQNRILHAEVSTRGALLCGVITMTWRTFVKVSVALEGAHDGGGRPCRTRQCHCLLLETVAPAPLSRTVPAPGPERYGDASAGYFAVHQTRERVVHDQGIEHGRPGAQRIVGGRVRPEVGPRRH